MREVVWGRGWGGGGWGAAKGGQSYVVNDQGDYLVHPDPQREFGFEFAKPSRIQDDFPDLAGILARGDTAPRVIQDRAGRRFGIGVDMVRLAEGPKLAVIQAVPYPVLTVATSAVRDSSLMAGILAGFCAFVLAVIVARSLTRPLVQMTQAVQAFSRDETLPLPTGGASEIGLLANASADMAEASRRKPHSPHPSAVQR